MKQGTRADFRAERVLVALDDSERGHAALQVALHLATLMQAELQGLFVEDEDLVRLAALPFAVEIDLSSAAFRHLQVTAMEESLRLAGSAAQQAFTAALQQAPVAWTFRVVRGPLTQVSLAAAGDVDLLVVGQRGRSPQLAMKHHLSPKLAQDAPVLAVFDGTESAFRTLEVASRLALPSERLLSILVLGSNGDKQVTSCLRWLQENQVRAEVDQNANPSPNAICDFVSQWPPSVLLVNRDSPFVNSDQYRRLVDESECTLVLC